MAAGLKEYQALMNLSVPQRDEAGKATEKNDLVTRGEKVSLTEKDARNFLNRTPPAIRDAKLASEPLPVYHPMTIGGGNIPLLTGARPDPAGSSAIQVIQPAVPELAEPHPGDETYVEVDAADIAPRGAGQAAGARIAAGARG